MTNAEAAPAPRPVRVASETLLLTHALLVGLTPLIPVPILDDAVKAAIERRMVREIGRANGQELDDEAVKALSDEPSGSLVGSIAKNVALFPFKLVFRKVFVVLEVKRASDIASQAYHRGHLLDLALASNVLAPRGPIAAAQVRSAVDAACGTVNVSPLGRAFRSAFESSKGALEEYGRALLSRLGRGGVGDVAKAVDEHAASAPRAGVMARLEEALRSVPREHFDDLETRFEERLGMRLVRR